MSELLFDNEMLDLFFQTMFERQEIWYKRFVKRIDKPWTKDEILANYKFCNVYRELDRSSQWLIQNVIKRSPQIKVSTIFQILIYRLYNKPEVFGKVGLPTISTYIKDKFTQSIANYEQVFGSSTNTKAYCINTWLSKGQSAGMANANIIVPSIFKHMEEIWSWLNDPMFTVKGLIQLFRKIKGIGNFVSHEWFIDLCYLKKYYENAFYADFNENSYTSVGPGAKAGIKLLTNSAMKLESITKELRDIAPKYLETFGEFKYLSMTKAGTYFVYNNDKIFEPRLTLDKAMKPNITLHTIEFWLCEFAKYVKMLNKYGRQRAVFIPTTSNNHFSY